MNAFTRAAAALVADANLGTAIIYQPAQAERVRCRGVFSRPVQEFGTAVKGGLALTIAAADVTAPARGDAVVLLEALRLGSIGLRAGLELRVEQVEAEDSMAMFDLTLAVP